MKRIIRMMSILILLFCFSSTAYAGEDFSKALVPADSVTVTAVGKKVIPNKGFSQDIVNRAEVIYRFKYQVTAKRADGKKITNRAITKVATTGPVVGYKCTKLDETGVGYIELDVRGANKFTMYCKLRGGGARSNLIQKKPTVSAVYETKFYCTAYYTPIEKEFTGTRVRAPGISGTKFYDKFLDAVKMNGSGMALNGKYLHYSSSTGTFTYLKPTTATGTTPDASKTIAVDPYFIPRSRPDGTWKRAIVDIEGIGLRRAEDGGGAIKGYRIDVYVGLGKKSLAGFKNGYRKVKLIRVE